MLREHRRRQDELRAARRGRWNEQEWVMATMDGRAMSPDTISSNGTRFVKTRKLPRLTLHGLRHPTPPTPSRTRWTEARSLS